MDKTGKTSFDRRKFLGLTAGAAAGVYVGLDSGQWLRSMVSAIDATPRPALGPETFVVSVCQHCPAGCGIRVRCIGGRPVKVDGNPLHPVSGGRSCPRGQAALQSLYHPDRIMGPMRRVGPKGSLDSFQRATWEEALDFMAQRLSLLRQQRRPQGLAVLRGGCDSIGSRLLGRFAAAFGSPNDVAVQRGDDAAAMALQLTQNVTALPCYDVEHAEYILAIGGALLEAAPSPVHAMRAYGQFRQGTSGRRGKLVVAAPRQSLTAVMADEWIPIRPGSEAVFAMGIASVMVSEELYDKEFVAYRTEQFEDVPAAANHGEAARRGLRSLLQQDYSLERVASETGVSVNTLLRIAREFAAARPGLAIGPRQGPLLPGRLFDHLAAHVLNGLAGNIDGPGGVLVPEPVPLRPWPQLPSDPVAETGRAAPRLDGAGTAGRALLRSDAEGLAEAILAADTSPVEVMLLLDSDPAFASLAPEVFRAALERVPLVVSFATMADDSSLHADWILPQAHPLERSDISVSPPGVSFPLVSHAAPVLSQPLADVRAPADIVLELARRLGGPVAAAMPWQDVDTLLQQEVRGLHESHRGAIIGTEFDEAWVQLMERAGWWAPGYRTEDELWQRVQEAGGWWDPLYDHRQWSRVLGSGRFRFCPEELTSLAAQRGIRPDLLSVERPGVASPEGALSLVLFEPLPIAGGTGAELPFLQAVIDPSHGQGWLTWVELHPETATSLGVEPGSMVRVASSHGSIRARVRVTERIVSGAAAIPVGLGKRAGGRWASGIGANPLRLLGLERERLSGLPDPGAVRVQVLSEEV